MSPHAQKRGMTAAVVEGALYTVWFSLLGNNFLTGFLLHMGATESQVGLTAALPPLASVVMVGAAYLLALLPRRRPFLMANAYIHRVLWSLAGFIPMVLPQSLWVWSFLALFLLSSLALSLAIPAWQSIMADMVPPQIRGSYFGVRSAVAQATAVLVTLVAGWWLDGHPGYAGFRDLYLWSLVAGVVNVSAFFWQPEPPYVRRPPESPMLHLTLPFRSTSFLWAIGFATAVTIASALVLPFYGVAMIKTMHLSYSLIARLMVVATVSGIVANLTLARLLDRLGLHRVLGALPALLALTPLLWLAIGPQSFALLYLAHVLQGAGVAMQLLVLSNLNFGMSPRADRPIYLAVFSSLSGLGGFVAPIVGGWVLGRFGFTVLLWSAMGCCVAAALLWQWRARAHVVETLGAQSEE